MLAVPREGKKSRQPQRTIDRKTDIVTEDMGVGKAMIGNETNRSKRTAQQTLR